VKALANKSYTTDFYKNVRNGATRSAEIIVPLVLRLIPVRTAVDVGCGDGSWLAVFRKLGVDEILGIDGDYVDRKILRIPEDRFQAIDLTKPFSLGHTFDLVVSLEVAEHLPASSAAAFVESLTRLGSVVLFSSAIPYQGGVDHVNEQWPDKWAALFRNHGYLPVDCIRKRVWHNDSVEWWYAQNTLLFAQTDLIESNAALKAEFERTYTDQLCLVHPARYLEAAVRAEQQPLPPGVKAASRLLLERLGKALQRRLRSISGKGPRL
jgi:SAM-dependent methyltransferase